MEIISVIIFCVILYVLWNYCGGSNNSKKSSPSSRPTATCGSTTTGAQNKLYPDLSQLQNNSIFNMFGGSSSYDAILDKFSTLEEVQAAIRKAGLESCNLIFGVDYTASNLQQGILSFGGRSLHDTRSGTPNPYQRVICILGETLEPFDDDGIIPAFGFGDVSTKGHGVFPFRSEGYCNGFHDVLEAYNQITPNVRMSGPTNFAPLIRQAIDIVKKTKSYHILVIVADGQVTNEQDTINAIVEASRWPLSIVMVGVGDGPWDVMKEFDDKIPNRKFDNFQFVEFNNVMTSSRNPQAAFALHALMEIPDQYKLIQKNGLLNF
ncbi:E3 ubiquitin-protein ligase RGLG5-like isoform X2 [Mizuhopecten yessoensis]|uniref:E3 ubiquitin-protein ligase RGLG5-like isoform X2 n=1 Tax=Mizuhopecten yessoensis TaxID=6573 RepID=UPI000B45C1E0|nr:E3 ubiquitin-protein ligase RGLG5-like isoform X2 [Mizuhopecten yessoensis]